MALHKVFDENGEYLTNIKYDTRSEEFRKIDYTSMNYILNLYNDGKCEIVYYKKGFKVPKYVTLSQEFMNNAQTFFAFESELGKRRFKRDADGIAVPIRSDSCIADLQNTMQRGGRRAKDNFYNYALSNEWEYFCTYTFADPAIRTNIFLLSKAWETFYKPIQRRFKDLKALAVPEPFENRASGYHLHALMANCDLTLLPKRSDKTHEFLFSDYGHPRMNCLDWKNGFAEVVMINPESSQLQVINYLSKYLTKSFNLPLGAHRFYRTKNLECKEKFIDYAEYDEMIEKVKSLGLKEYVRQNQKNHDIVIYRNF